MARPSELISKSKKVAKKIAPPAAKKRGRAVDEDEEEDGEEEDEDEDDEDDEDEAPPKRTAKKAPAKKRRPSDNEDDEDDEDDEEEDEDEAPPKRSAKKAPVKKRRPSDDDEDEDDRPTRSGGLYAGVTGSKPRADKISLGAFKVELVGIKESDDNDRTTAITTLRILEMRNKTAKTHDYVAGKTEVVILETVRGGAKWVAQYGRERHVGMAMAFAGFESTEGAEYIEMDPKGMLLDATAGISNRWSRKGATLAGRTAYLLVTKRGEADDGTPYCNYAWSPDPDLEKFEAP